MFCRVLYDWYLSIRHLFLYFYDLVLHGGSLNINFRTIAFVLSVTYNQYSAKSFNKIRCGVMVNIAVSHTAARGSIPRIGNYNGLVV